MMFSDIVYILIHGVNKQTSSGVDSEKVDDSEVSLDPKSIASPQTQRKSEVDVEDKDNSDDEYEVDALKSKQELGTISDDLGVVEASNAIDEALDEVSDESDNISSDNLEAVIDVNVEAVDEKGKFYFVINLYFHQNLVRWIYHTVVVVINSSVMLLSSINLILVPCRTCNRFFGRQSTQRCFCRGCEPCNCF